MAKSTKKTVLETIGLESNHTNGGTVIDGDEMHRMGKIQEFQVCKNCTEYIQVNIVADRYRSVLETHATACCIEFRISLASDLGISNNVRAQFVPPNILHCHNP